MFKFLPIKHLIEIEIILCATISKIIAIGDIIKDPERILIKIFLMF